MGSDPVRRYIVGIGVGEYDLPQLRLPRVSSDVDSIVGWFERHPRFVHERALPELSLNPTWERMQSGLRGWLEGRTPADVVVIYIAAHGEYEGGRAYLFGSNTPRTSLAGAALEAQTLGAMLGQFRAHNVLMIIDACVAGKLASQIQRAAEDAADERNTREPQRAWAQVILCSTFGRDPALDGRFARAFIDVVNSEKWTGTTRPWVDIDQLMRGINEELRNISAPQVAERKVWGPSPAELIPNPNFATRQLGVLVAEEELTAHFDPSARGVSRGEAGMFFTGREQELRRLCGWLSSARADTSASRLMVITGSPGSGKSALLSRLVMLSDKELRASVGDLSSLPAGTLPPLDAFDVVVWCHNKSARQVVVEIGKCLGGEVETTSSLLEAARGQRLSLAIDALDEAQIGQASILATKVIAPLAKIPGVRMLVATRRSPVRVDQDSSDLLKDLQAEPAQVLALDQSRNTSQDMHTYVQARLTTGTGAASSVYDADPSLTAKVATRIVQAAGASFLIAAITAKTLAASDSVAEPQTLSLPTAVGDAMAGYLDRLANPEAVRDILRPLAWAQGAGLPWGELWPRIATALATMASNGLDESAPPPTYGDADVQMALDAAGDFIVESVENGDPVYRLFHEALAEHLRGSPSADSEDMLARVTASVESSVAAHAVIADALVEHMGGRPWTTAPHYVVAHLRTHLLMSSKDASALVELVSDPLWERARRELSRGVTAWLEDVDTALLGLMANDANDARQVGLCVLYARKLATAPLPILNVLARTGQLKRAELLANNLATASKRVHAYCMLAAAYMEVADADSARRCLDRASSAAAVVEGTHLPRAKYYLVDALVACRQPDRAWDVASEALQAALESKRHLESANDTWDVPNALFWAAKALRRIGDTEGLAALHPELAGLVRFCNLTLQFASVIGHQEFLRACLKTLKEELDAGHPSSIRPGNLALALADAGMSAELDELISRVSPSSPAAAGEADAQKRFVWGLAIATRMTEALAALEEITVLEERLLAAIKLAELAAQRGDAGVLSHLSDWAMSDTTPREVAHEVLAAQLLCLTGHHEAALLIVEDTLRRPDLSSASSGHRSSAKRSLVADTGSIDGSEIVPRVAAMLAEHRTEEAISFVLSLAYPVTSKEGIPRSPHDRGPQVVPAELASALRLIATHVSDPQTRRDIWFEALRQARFAGHVSLSEVLADGPDTFHSSPGPQWEIVEEELIGLDRRWEIESFSEQFDTLRSAFGSGFQRTTRMTSLMLVPRRQSAHWRPEELRRAVQDGQPAQRVFALGLMRGNPALVDPALVIAAISQSHSAFEQYQALRVAQDTLGKFQPEHRQALAEALAAELADDGSGRGQIGDDTSRRRIACSLLEQLGVKLKT